MFQVWQRYSIERHLALESPGEGVQDAALDPVELTRQVRIDIMTGSLCTNLGVVYRIPYFKLQARILPSLLCVVLHVSF